MKSTSNAWKPHEDEWKSIYHSGADLAYNKESDSKIKMNLEVHNKLAINYDKTFGTISYFARSVLGKFPRKKKWKLEVWLEEKNTKIDPHISCGVALRRPRKGTLYAKKVASNLSDAAKQSISVIEKSLRREGTRWSHNQLHHLIR